MYLVTNKQKRPNTSVEFFSMHIDSYPTNLKSYFHETYKKPGKLVFVEKTVSEDGLEQTTTTMWESKQVYQDFIKDANLADHWALQSNYMSANAIVPERIDREEI